MSVKLPSPLPFPSINSRRRPHINPTDWNAVDDHDDDVDVNFSLNKQMAFGKGVAANGKDGPAERFMEFKKQRTHMDSENHRQQSSPTSTTAERPFTEDPKPAGARPVATSPKEETNGLHDGEFGATRTHNAPTRIQPSEPESPLLRQQKSVDSAHKQAASVTAASHPEHDCKPNQYQEEASVQHAINTLVFLSNENAGMAGVISTLVPTDCLYII